MTNIQARFKFGRFFAGLTASAFVYASASVASAATAENGINLQGVSLNGINLQGVSLNGINLQGVSLNGINLQGVDLNGINLQGVSLNGVSLNAADAMHNSAGEPIIRIESFEPAANGAVLSTSSESLTN